MCMFSRFSCVQVFVTLWTTRLLCPLQGIFPTQEWNWGLLHCRRILHQLSHRALSSSSDSATTLSPSSQESAAARWTGRQEVGSPSPLWSPGPGRCEKHRLHRKQTSWANPPPTGDLTAFPHCTVKMPQASVSSSEERGTHAPCRVTVRMTSLAHSSCS